MDHNSLEPYGGFEKMLQNVSEGHLTGTAYQDFAYTVYAILADGADPIKLLACRGSEDHVADEIREGIENLSAIRKKEVRDKLRKVLDL